METENGWTIGTYAAHNEAMRAAEVRFTEAMRAADKRFDDERDRRNVEVDIEKEKALKIKELADAAALELDRESRAYKDEQADKIREQSLTERGAYITRGDFYLAIEEIKTSLKPVFEYISGQQGAVKGAQITMGKIYAAIGGATALFGIVAYTIDRLTG